MRRWAFILVAVCAQLAVGAPFARAGFIQNGNFSDPLAPAWTTEFGAAPTVSGGVVTFAESSTFAQVQLQQVFTLPTDATSISFEYLLTSTGGEPNVGDPPDSFQATLWNSDFSGSYAPTDPNDPLDFPAFFSVDRTGQQFTGPYSPSPVSTMTLADGWTLVTLDVTGDLAQQNDPVLEFILNGGDDGYTTTAYLRNVQGNEAAAAPTPEPASLLLFAGAGSCLLVRGLFQRAVRRKSHAPQR